MAKTIYVLNGPNMNLLGTREPEKYGRATLADVEKLCAETANRFGVEVVCRQSNKEGELVDWIQEAHSKKAAGIVINPNRCRANAGTPTRSSAATARSRWGRALRETTAMRLGATPESTRTRIRRATS